MTSSLDVVTSESPDVNTSNIFDVTMAATTAKSLRRHVMPSTQFFAQVSILFGLTVINLCGNGFTLITIRMTPRLWTKTNFIMASMLLSHFITGVSMLWYNPYILLSHIFNNPCRLSKIVTAMSSLIKMTSYVSNHHCILIAVERYIAIVYPLQYENRFSDRIMKWGIFVIWSTGILEGMTFMLWLIDADPRKCTLIPAKYQVLDFILYIPICTFLLFTYGRILAISWRQRRRIQPQPTYTNAASGPSLKIH